MNNNMEREIFDLYIDDIIPNRFQPRLAFDEKSLNELADSIKQHGIIQPLVVRKIGDKYEIIAGERRCKAAQKAGLQKVPAVIMNLDDKQSAEVAVIENIQRRDLTALEEAESYKKLLDKGYLTQEQLATRMGKAQATISNKLRLLALPVEVKDALLNEKISERHARSLLSLKDPNDQKETLNKIMNNKLTVRQTDELIKSMIGEPVETLDFNVAATQVPTIPTILVPETPIQTPVVAPIEPISEPVVAPITPFIEGTTTTSYAPISNIDINQMKEGTADIYPTGQMADVNALLGINSSAEVAVTNPVNKIEQSRFITPLEDEEANMEMQEPITSPVQPTIEPIPTPFGDAPIVEQEKVNVAPVMDTFAQAAVQQEPISKPFIQEPVTYPESKTYTDSLVREFRQSNGPSADTNKVVPGDLRSAISNVREITHLLESNNFKVDVEEFDFEHLYQIIIKIDK